MIGIYKITNKINNKVYIGQSVDIRQRWNAHRHAAKIEQHPLYRAMRKYGIENFSFEVIEECTFEQLNEKEIYWIQYYNSTNNEKGYNIKLGGEGSNLERLYSYEEIYKKWKEGFNCKQIQEIFSCGDQTIIRALRTFGITELDVKSRSFCKKEYVALSKDKKPLKIFKGSGEISRYFTGKDYEATDMKRIILNHLSLFGYYWDYLTDKNYPKEELTDEKFLSYQIKKIKECTEEQRRFFSESQRVVERPSREELKRLIRTEPFVQIGKSFGVSDSAIRKWCDFENLPRKKNEINKYSDEEWELI